jgi:LysR family hydrogen peroxide-inducible transcriptional activator
MPADHPLSAKDNLDNEDLAGQTVLSLSPAYTLHDQIAALCTKPGRIFRANTRARRSTRSADGGHGHGPDVPAGALRAIRDRRAPRRRRRDTTVPWRRFSRSIGLVWRKNSGAAPAFDRLADTIRDTARRFPDLVIES